jgi:hypothetical protein
MPDADLPEPLPPDGGATFPAELGITSEYSFAPALPGGLMMIVLASAAEEAPSEAAHAQTTKAQRIQRIAESICPQESATSSATISTTMPSRIEPHAQTRQPMRV